MTAPFPPRKMRVSNIDDGSFASNGPRSMDQAPYADFSGSAYAPDGRVPIDHESTHVLAAPRRKRNAFVTKNAHVRECMAEFLATTVAISFGLAGIQQNGLWNGQYGDTMTTSVGWGVALMVGTFIGDNVSGAHLISVITITNAVYGRLPWWKVPGYLVAQMLGAFVAAALIYVLNCQRILREDPEKQTMHKLFITGPRDGVSNYTAFYTEVLACAYIMLVSYAIKDPRNCWPGKKGTPFALTLLVIGISCCFMSNSALGMSPNRDFAPRLFMYIVGYHQVFTMDSYYFWIPMVATLIGGVIGGGLYIFFVEMQHPEVPQKNSNTNSPPLLAEESV